MFFFCTLMIPSVTRCTMEAALLIRRVVPEDCEYVVKQSTKMTLFQNDCFDWMTSKVCAALHRPELVVLACYLPDFGSSEVLIGHIQFTVSDSVMTVWMLCALVPRACVGLSLLHAAVGIAVHEHDATSVKLTALGASIPFYKRLKPTSVEGAAGNKFTWASARLLLVELDERAAACVVSEDSFWLRLYRAYVDYVQTNDSIYDWRLQIAAAQNNVAEAVKAIKSSYPSFAAFLAARMPHFEAGGRHRSHRTRRSRRSHKSRKPHKSRRTRRSRRSRRTHRSRRLRVMEHGVSA
jgi:hypothetical protein